MARSWVVAAVLLAGCSSMSRSYESANIRIVTHPGLVQGMRLLDGYSGQAGGYYGPAEVGRMAANDAAKKGYRDCTVLVEMVDGGTAGTGYSLSRNPTWRVSIYR